MSDRAWKQCERDTTPQVAIAETGRLLAWVPGRLRNPLNGSQGTTRGGRIMRSQDRRDWRERTCLCTKDAMTRARWRYGPLSRALIVLTAYVWNRFDEHDGLRAALKPVVDGLADARLISGDGPQTSHRLEYRQVINRRHRGVEVVVEILRP